MATPLLPQQRCSPDKDSLSPPWPSGLELGCYLMWLWLARPASPQWVEHWVLMLFLLKENAGATGLCEFWQSDRLPGNVPRCFWVCCRRPSGFGDVSCWFSVILSHVFSVQFPHKADVLSNLRRWILWWAWLDSCVRNIGVLAGFAANWISVHMVWLCCSEALVMFHHLSLEFPIYLKFYPPAKKGSFKYTHDS